MNLQRQLDRMATNSEAIASLTRGIADEEREDFRVRLDFILHRPGEEWPPIDPRGWVTARRYNEKCLGPSVESFLAERARSLAWLRGLGEPDWLTEGTAPFGKITSGDMFASWVAHDVLHLRQLVRLQWALTIRSVEPHATRYAGEW